jgi:hypothetical protein
MLFMQQAIKVGENCRPFQAIAAFQAWTPVLMQKLFLRLAAAELYTKHQLPCLSKLCSTLVNLNATN